MRTVTSMIQGLKKHILELHIGTEEVPDFDGITLLKQQTELSDCSIYIGTYTQGLLLLTACAPEFPVTMFLSADNINTTKLPDPSPHNLIVTTLDIPDLYNHLDSILRFYQQWKQTLWSASRSRQSVSSLLSSASHLLGSQIYLLNPGYKLIAKSTPVYHESAISQELEELGYLSFETINNLTQVHLMQLPYPAQDGFTLLVPSVPQAQTLDYPYLLTSLAEILADTLADYQLTNRDSSYHQDILFRTFLDDLLEERLDSSVEIQNRLLALAQPTEAFCCFLLIRFDTELPDGTTTFDLSVQSSGQKESRYSYMLQQLKSIFPRANMGLYKHDIVILHSQQERPLEKMNFDYDKLALLLDSCNAYAGISNASRHRTRLRTLYLLASRTLELGRCLHRPGLPDRIFSYEDYSMSYIIDLCAQQFINIHHHNDLIYLIHPSIIKICRYDAAHHTNLCDVLFYYLLCGCNVSRTAKIMYMHRNTILNKLNKLNEIAQIPLEDGYTQQRMIFSCLVIQYYEKYLNLTIQL